ncbi:MAG: protein translocase subunit SecF [Candidatus Cloacimonetes bacterium]|jgi:preprotein translocase subunit SecF|nr:protein translocase subunit SecF [Candidatus Cloacimonadota bacterium]MCB5279148.1 protein translocase subunit SecF [Candidatus Cloacimonadota bacterium]MDD4686793.1 protein translocase subunit SecF [Candidatus Cloacimonadota bacterium]MDY0298730.1 protein translocase subunit SecF [Candidatus Cloacimonadaceae bacterium]
MRLLKNTNIPFVGMRKGAYLISILLILAAIIGLFVRGLNWSIDFTSGVAAKVDLQALSADVAPVEIDELRNALKTHGFPEAEIQRVGEFGSGTFMIKIKSANAEDAVSSDTKTQIIDIISESFPDHLAGRDINRDVIEEIYEVGPKVGGELRTNALLAVAISLILMIIYIWFRFELIFGLMAIVALAHDVLIIVGVFALSGKEITIQIIAALLTIVGYSINDTIVIFDRIREDLKIRRKEPLDQVINYSLNETLSRTVVTSGTTFFTTLSLYLFGGQVLNDFALAMCLGVIVGTYSSIFLASNLVIDLTKATHKEKQAAQHLSKRK